MLVVTRRSQEKLLFPDIGLKIQILRILGGNVRIGIDAPKELTVLRNELMDDDSKKGCYGEMARQLRHQLRNDLQQVSVALHLFKELREADLADEAEETFSLITSALKKINDNPLLSSFIPPSSQLPTVTQPQIQVVLAEDDFEQRTLLAKLLRARKLDVIELANGSEVVEFFSKNDAPRFLLIDMNMPTCDGATAIQQLRKDGKLDQTVVFAVSGRTPEDYGLPIGEAGRGVDSWFPKPINPVELMNRLCEVPEVA